MNFRVGGLQRRREKKIVLDVINLIDIVFLLLIFFIVTASFNQISKITINLPKATENTSNSLENLIDISVNVSGEISINNEHLVNKKRNTLFKALQNTVALMPEKNAVQIRILGDAKAPHESIVSVMDVVGELGINQVQIATVH